MPSQPTIRDYFQPSATGSDNSDGAETDGPFDRLMQFVHQNIQRLDNSSRAGMAQIESLIQTAFTKMEEENRQIKVQMENKLREAETAIAESRREVARLSAEIADLRNVVNQRPGQTDAVDGGEQCTAAYMRDGAPQDVCAMFCGRTGPCGGMHVHTRLPGWRHGRADVHTSR